MSIIKNLETIIGYLDKLLTFVPPDDPARHLYEQSVNMAIRSLRYVQKLKIMNTIQKAQKPSSSSQ